MKKHLLSILLAAILVLCLWCAASAYEADYFTYLDENGKERIKEDSVEILTKDRLGEGDYHYELQGGWYAVESDITAEERIVCYGSVHLILTDGYKLNAKKGIEVSAEGASLTVYAGKRSSSTEGIEGTGILTATGADWNAGIGGSECKAGHDITINGGYVTANGGNGAAGIGGGYEGSGSNITINGGYVTANGGEHGAGIGGGEDGSGSNIKINGGTVTAKGGDGGAGIGGGEDGSGSYITITGGTVTATGGNGAAGIGGGDSGSGYYITVTVSTTVTTKHGDGKADTEVILWNNRTKAAAAGGFAEGTKRYFTMTPDENAETVSVKYLDAKGRTQTHDAILMQEYTLLAGGWYAVSGSLTVSDRIVCDGAVNLILLDGCDLQATKGIEVSATGASLTVYAGKKSTDTGDIEGKGRLTAKGDTYAAGIGGGDDQSGHDITINGGTVNATGGSYSAGIGGGYGGSGTNITVNGGNVTATGGSNAAGIGGGGGGSGTNITVTESADYLTKHGESSADAKIVAPGDRSKETTKGGFADGTDHYFIMGPFFTVTFDPGDYGQPIDPQHLFPEEKAVRPDDPTDGRAVFINWYADGDYQKLYDFDTPVTEDITVYAKWSALVEIPTALNPVYNATEQTGVSIDGNAPYTYSGTAAVNAGQYETVFTLTDGYAWDDESKSTGQKKVKWEIIPLPLTEDMIADIPDQTWTGEAVTPDVTVTVNNVTLMKDTDYQVSYANNVEEGEATVTVSPAGNPTNLSGEATKTFKISKSTDQQAAEAVIALINAIGEVKYPDSGDAIDAARKAYDALTDTQKALVTNCATLTAAETEYARLKAAAEAAEADKQAAEAVVALINAIGEVKYPDSGEAIDAARTAYDALTDTRKALVTNYTTLTDAEKEYARLKAEAEAAEADKKAAEAVVALINAIGEVKYPDSGEAIEKARTAYDKLTDTQKALVSNYTTLTDAEAAYEALKPRSYVILDGDGQTVLLDGITPAVFRGSGDLAVFTGLEIDGKAVDRKYYSTESGSTIVRVDPAYVRMIGVGKHTLKMIWTNGTATACFTVQKPPEPPVTGDGTPLTLLAGLLILSVTGLILQRRRRGA